MNILISEVASGRRGLVGASDAQRQLMNEFS
jgi:hypothetical protein